MSLLGHSIESTERLDSVIPLFKDLFQNGESFLQILINVFEGAFCNLKLFQLFYFLVTSSFGAHLNFEI
jgi:hypothetical protein